MSEIKSWREHQGEVIDSVEGFDVIECQTCGFKHIVPIPMLEELEGLYRENYYSQEKPLYFERHREDIDWWNMVYAERYEFFEQYLPPTCRRILDIGSGPGFFLKLGKERGWETLGIEPSEQAAEHARGLGLEIVKEFLSEDNADRFGAFDVVHLHEVLEHIPDPVGMLRLVKRLLNTGGLLCVVVPNDYNPFQYTLRTVCGYEPWWVAPPHHINYFDFNSLSRLLTAHGFEVVLREATFPIDMFLLMGDNYVGNDEVGRMCHAKRKTLEQNLAKAGMGILKRNWYRAMADLGIGREAVLISKLVR